MACPGHSSEPCSLSWTDVCHHVTVGFTDNTITFGFHVSLTSWLFLFICDSGKDPCKAGLSDPLVAEQDHPVNTLGVTLRVIVRVTTPVGPVVEGLVSRVVGSRLSQKRVAALGPGLLWVVRGSGKPRGPSQGWVMTEIGGSSRCATSPLQRLLVSLGVEGHVATVTTSGRERPEGADVQI